MATPNHHGLIYDMPEHEYHAHPALSQSGMKRILDCPARYRWEQDNPPAPKDHFDLGAVAHGLILGTGPEIEVIHHPNRMTNAAKDAIKAAREAGKVPILEKDYAAAEAIGKAVQNHPLASAFLALDGHSEVSAFWEDPDTGVQLRGRYDKLVTMPDGRACILDVKTTGQTAEPEAFMRQAAGFGYHLQLANYVDGHREITGEEPLFLFIVVETKDPHLVSVIAPDEEALATGRARVADAIATYQQCTASNEWFSYTETAAAVGTLPRWAVYEADREDY